MTDSYLQLLVESLEKKCEVLDKILEVDDRQAALCIGPGMDMIAYDATVDEKSDLLEELNKLDEGFTSTFEIIKDELLENTSEYKKEIALLKDLIRETMDKTTSIEAKETRNKMALDSFFKAKRNEVKQQRVNSSVVSKYYKSMSKINDVDPQLMDKKK